MIVDKFYVNEHKPWSAFPRGTFRMSGAEMCTRRAGYQFLKYEEDEDPKEGEADFKSVVLEEGNIQEVEMVRRVQLTGYKVWNYGDRQTWTAYKTESGQFWRGHPDLFINIEGVDYGIEIKSTRDSLFQKYANRSEEVLPGRFILHDQTILHDATFPYMGQIQMYLHSSRAEELNIQEWILIVKNRDNGAVLECFIKKDPEYLEAITSKWKSFWTLMLAGRLPERNFANTSTQCKLCPFAKKCWGPLFELPAKSLTIEDEDLIQAAKDWRIGNQAAKKGETIVENAKSQFLNVAIGSKANRLLIDGIEITISERSREGLATEKVSSLLNRLVNEGIITSDEAAECYSTTKYMQTNIRDKS